MALARISGTLGLVALAAVVGAPAKAADSGWYIGANLGRSQAKIDDPRIVSGLLFGGFTTTSIVDYDHHLAYKLLGGYQFNKYFALEAGYFDLGRFGFTASTVPAGTLHGDLKLQGEYLDALGMVPFTDKFSAFGRVGANYAETKDAFSGTGFVGVPNPTRNEYATHYKFGVGLEYHFTAALGGRVEAERYRIDDAVGNKGDIDLFSVGLVYRFGGRAASAPTPMAAAPAPAVIAEAPVPAPVVVIVPAPAKTEQYCSILDIQFEINKDTVQRESDEKIEKLATFMRKYPDTTAVIEGHADEVGTPAANLSLSQRRAEGVMNYLVDHGGIARSRIQAVGYGETRPVADNNTEVGKRLNRRVDAVIACATDLEGLTPIRARITMAMEMEFDTNRAEVRPQYADQLRKVANFMQANPGVTATVEGHTSNQAGTPAQAMQLSVRRAENVVNALVTQFAVERSRLTAAGFGQTRRFAYNTSAEGQQENRRVNIIFDFPDERQAR